MSDNNKKPVVKGELLSYGFAPYQDDPTQRQSYFVEIKHDNGIAKKEWGVDLERALNESNVQIGDTVILNNLGRQPVNIPDPQDETKTKTVTKNLWEMEKYEPVLDLPNVIEHDTEREQQQAVATDKTKENEEDVPNQPKKTPNLSDFEFELPSNIKNNYIAIVKNRHLSDQKINYYDKDDKDQVNIAFEDRNKSLHTSRQDEKTIYAMLDMAQSKGWSDIKLKGTEEFKQKAWLEASLRGIGVKGYEPNEKDLAELQAKQQARTTNQVEMTAQKPLETNQQAKVGENQPQQTPPTQEQDNQGVNFDFLNENALNEPQQPPAPAMSDRDYTDEEMALYEQQQLAKWEAERLSLYEQNEHTYTDEDMERYEQQVYDQWENNQLAEQTPPTQAEPLDIGVQTQEQSHVQNDRFTFEAMTAEDVGIGESEYLRQATHITDRETGEHYIIGNYDFEHDGNVHNGVITEYYTDEQALAERDDNALIGGERIFSKLGIHDKGLVNHIEGDSRLTAEQLDKAVSLETLKNTVSNQPIMPNKEFELVSESIKQAEFDSRELALAQTAMLRNYDVSWDRLDQHEKYERLASSVGEYKIDEQKYNQFIDNLQRNINQDLSYLKYETKEINQEPTPQKSAEDIKKDIRQIFQTGYKDGSIKSRDELVEVLKERGFEVKENDKSIRVSLPNSDQAVNLKGEVFTKGYDAIKSLKERLEPETLKQTYPTLTDSDIVHVTAYKNKLFDSNRDMQTPKVLQASLVRLEDSIKDMAKGKDVNLPDLPVNEIKPDIEVRTTDNHDKIRQV